MSSVARVRVGDVLRLERRAVVVDPTVGYEEIGVRSFGRGIFHKEPVEGAILGSKRVFRIEPGDLVISNVFAWEGAIAVASAAETGRIGSHRFMTFVPSDSRIDPAWAAWYLLSEPGLELIRKASPGSAGRNKTLAVSRFEDLVIGVPPIEEQRLVAARLDAARAAGERISQLTARSTSIATALRTAITTRGARSWPTVSLREVLRIDLHETAVDGMQSYDMAGVYSFGRGLFERARLEGAQTAYSTLHRLETGQLVMSRLKAWEGALATVNERFNGSYLSPEFPTFTPDEPAIDVRFLNAIVTSEPFWAKLASTSKGMGARRERVHAERLLDQEISLPPLDVQRVIAESIGRAELLRHKRETSQAYLAALLPAMLNREFAALA